MGKWLYDWSIQYYGSGCFIRSKLITAKTSQEALKKLRDSETVIEVISCRRVERW